MQVRKQQLELDMEKQTGSKYEKEYVMVVYCHPAYLTSMQRRKWQPIQYSCLFYDPADAGNLISGFSAFSKSIWNIWKFMVHILLKPDLENFELRITLLVCDVSAIVR